MPPPEIDPQSDSGAGAQDAIPAPVTDPPSIHAVALKIPPFWASDPLIWFAQVEAQFLTRGIVAEATKYAHIIASLQPEVAQEVRDLLLTPPKENPYQTLKETLIQRTSASEQKRVQLLLNEEVLGDRKPTQLLRRMQQLLGGRQIEAGILRQLFLQRLPPNIRLILTSAGDSTTIEDLAALADRLVEQHVPTISHVFPTAEASDLRDQLTSLTKQVSALQLQLDRQRSRSRSRSRRPSKARAAPSNPSAAHVNSDTSASTPCWYHARFGENAHKCVQPCSYSAPENQGNAPPRG